MPGGRPPRRRGPRRRGVGGVGRLRHRRPPARRGTFSGASSTIPPDLAPPCPDVTSTAGWPPTRPPKRRDQAPTRRPPIRMRRPSEPACERGAPGGVCVCPAAEICPPAMHTGTGEAGTGRVRCERHARCIGSGGRLKDLPPARRRHAPGGGGGACSLSAQPTTPPVIRTMHLHSIEFFATRPDVCACSRSVCPACRQKWPGPAGAPLAPASVRAKLGLGGACIVGVNANNPSPGYRPAHSCQPLDRERFARFFLVGTGHFPLRRLHRGPGSGPVPGTVHRVRTWDAKDPPSPALCATLETMGGF